VVQRSTKELGNAFAGPGVDEESAVGRDGEIGGAREIVGCGKRNRELHASSKRKTMLASHPVRSPAASAATARPIGRRRERAGSSLFSAIHDKTCCMSLAEAQRASGSALKQRRMTSFKSGGSMLESRPALGAFAKLGRKHFERDFPVELRVLREIDRAYPALSELLDDAVVRERPADHRPPDALNSRMGCQVTAIAKREGDQLYLGLWFELTAFIPR
jgi:hypothetical protein